VVLFVVVILSMNKHIFYSPRATETIVFTFNMLTIKSDISTQIDLLAF